MSDSSPEAVFLDLAVARGLLSPALARQALARPRGAEPLPDLLVRSGHLQAPAAAALRAEVAGVLAARSRTPPRPQLSGSSASFRPSPPPSSAPPPGFSPEAATVVGLVVPSPGLSTSLPLGPDPSSSSRPAPTNALADTLGPEPTLVAARRDEPPSFRPKPGTRFGRYELQGELGRGGMGIVFRARHADLDRIVALKMLLAGGAASPVEVERFFAEARHAAKLTHPSIVPVHDVGEIDGIHYFTMDFVEGKDLAAIVREGRPTFERSAEIMAKVADALAFAHGRGVIHRDMKPGNVLIDRNGNPRITDFGIAKELGKSSSTRAGEVLGTPSYMPPEQADGNALAADARADIYSTGAILYELLTGQPPFAGRTGLQTIHAVVHERPKAPRALASEIPRDLETIVLRCLEKDRDRRYAKASELAADLRRFRAGEPILATPPGEPEVEAAPSRPLPVGLLVVVLAVAAGVGGYVYAARVRHLEAEAQALEARRRAEEKAAAARAAEAEKQRAAAESATALVKAALEAASRDARDTAVARALEAVEVAPKLLLARETLARFYLELRQEPELARAEAEKALALSQGSLDAHRTRARALLALARTEDALKEAAALEALGEKGKAAGSLVRGQALAARDERDGAWRALLRAVELAPQDAAPLIALARSGVEWGRTEEALRHADAAASLEPRNPEPQLLRAAALEKIGRKAEALQAARKATELAPTDRAARELAQRLQATLGPPTSPEGDRHKAAELATAALARGDRAAVEAFLAQPDEGACVHVVAVRANLLWRLGRLPEAEEAFSRAIGVEPTNVAHLGNRGLVRLALDRAADALADFEVALGSGSTPPGMYPAVVGRAHALEKLGRQDDALAVWNQAVASAPATQRAQTLHDRGKHFLARERFDEAEKDLSTAIELAPNVGHYWHDRGDVKEKRGDLDGARADWQSALGKKLAPDETARIQTKISKRAEAPKAKAPPDKVDTERTRGP